LAVGNPAADRLSTPASIGPKTSAQAPEPAHGVPEREDPDDPSALPTALRLATRAGVALCVAVSLVHVLFLFLHVAPPNAISQRYARQVQGWVYPLFEQNWRLFAPDPESAVPQISVRTASSGATPEVSGWFDLTAVDNAAVRHKVFPSHTAQNMLRRAWTGYLESHGTSDLSATESAVMWQEYLRNIAVDRVTALRRGAVAGGAGIAGIQLRVRTRPVMGYDAAGHPRTAPPSTIETRYLPWWKATTNDD
jgi:hypothetical protein